MIFNHLQNRLKRGATMNKPFLRYALSPLATLFALILIDQAARRELLTVSLAFPVGIMALCLFWSGLRANILSAILITAYALYSSHFDLSRAGQIAFTVWPVAIFGGVMRRWLIESVAEAERQRLRAAENQEKADRYDILNGNIERLKRSTERLYDLVQAWRLLDDNKRLEVIKEVRNDLANLATVVDGWRLLAQEKRDILASKE